MKYLLAIFLLTTSCYASGEKDKTEKSLTLAQMLGFKETDKLLIINADDAGMSHCSNQGVIKAMTKGLVSSASIMVPCPFFNEIADFARENPDKDFGVHLTHTSEWKNYRWSPMTGKEETPGLRDNKGFMHSDVKTLYKNSTPEEAYLEAKAQIKKAIKKGIKISHIDSHMGAMQFNPEYARMYAKLAREFNLPLRFPSIDVIKKHKAEKLVYFLDKNRILYPDYLVYGLKSSETKTLKQTWLDIINNLKPGVTEVFIHPTVADDEIKSITHSWKTRAEELRLFTEDEDIMKALTENDIKIISYRSLFEWQQKNRNFNRKHLPIKIF